ncbi:MAG: RnfABCDGE type electron transport complex subunit G [Alistipes sp.]
MKSTLINMVTVLFTITLLASAGVGVVNMITLEPIAQAKEAAVVEALNKVLPAFENSTSEELTIDELPIVVYTATAADGSVVGYAVQSATKNGFGGMIKMMVGFSPAGEVLNVNVLEQAETPGLGTKMCDEGNPLLLSVKGKNLETMQLVEGKLAVRKDGGDVDALTAATISSRAYCDAMNRAWMGYTSVKTGIAATDSASGATQPADGASGATPANAADSARYAADVASGATVEVDDYKKDKDDDDDDDDDDDYKEHKHKRANDSERRCHE